MKQKKTASPETTSIKMLLKGIELLGVHQRPTNAEKGPFSQFNFKIHLETKADSSNKLLFAIVHVEILTEDQSLVLGSISVSCIFQVQDFDALIQIAADGKPRLVQPLVQLVNDISLSTTRGIMFSAFKGTPLHNAILPIIDSQQF